MEAQGFVSVEGLCSAGVQQALQQVDQEITVIDIDSPDSSAASIGKHNYERASAAADPAFLLASMRRMASRFSCSITSGTPRVIRKGVSTAHRGAYSRRLARRQLGLGFDSKHLSLDIADVSIAPVVLSMCRRPPPRTQVGLRKVRRHDLPLEKLFFLAPIIGSPHLCGVADRN